MTLIGCLKIESCPDRNVFQAGKTSGKPTPAGPGCPSPSSPLIHITILGLEISITLATLVAFFFLLCKWWMKLESPSRYSPKKKIYLDYPWRSDQIILRQASNGLLTIQSAYNFICHRGIATKECQDSRSTCNPGKRPTVIFFSQFGHPTQFHFVLGRSSNLYFFLHHVNQ